MNAAENEKIHAMHRRFGTCGVLKCDGCSHLLRYEYTKRRYYKCELYGTSCSKGTDWRLTYQACGMRDIEQDMTNWTPICKQIYRRRNDEQPINGQIRMEIVN